MLVVSRLNFVPDTKILCGYNFVALLINQLLINAESELF